MIRRHFNAALLAAATLGAALSARAKTKLLSSLYAAERLHAARHA